MKSVEIFENYIINIDSDIFHCLPKFEVNNLGSLLVVKDSMVVGTITDGDIRKALINNRLLTMPIKHVMNSSYKFGFNESECLKILEDHSYIFVVPLVSEDRRLLKIFLRS